jgi:hypothetical protein
LAKVDFIATTEGRAAKRHPNLPLRSLAAYHSLHFPVTTSFSSHPSAMSELWLFGLSALEKTNLGFALVAEIRIFFCDVTI